MKTFVRSLSLAALLVVFATATPGAFAQPKSSADQIAKNKAAATKLFHAGWDRGDFAVLDEMIPADALDHSTIPGKSPEKGPASFKSIIGMFRAAIPDIKLTVDDEIAEGDKVCHRWTLKGTHTGTPLFGVPASGKVLTFGGTTIVRIKNGKVAERWSNVDEMALARQLGLVPPPGGPAKK